MPSFLDYLKGGIAQANPWDNGADFNSVMRDKERERQARIAAQRKAIQDQMLAQRRAQQGGGGSVMRQQPRFTPQAQTPDRRFQPTQNPQAGQPAIQPRNPLVQATKNSVINQTKAGNVNTKWGAPKMLTPQGQQAWQDKRNMEQDLQSKDGKKFIGALQEKRRGEMLNQMVASLDRRQEVAYGDRQIGGEFGADSINSLIETYGKADPSQQLFIRDRIQKQLRAAEDDYTDDGAIREHQLGYLLSEMEQNKKRDVRSTALGIGKGMFIDPLTGTGDRLARMADAALGNKQKQAEDMIAQKERLDAEALKAMRSGNRRLGAQLNYEGDVLHREIQRLLGSQIENSDPLKAAGGAASAVALPVAYAANAGTTGAAGKALMGGAKAPTATSLMSATPAQLAAKALPNLGTKSQAVAAESIANVASGVPQSVSETLMALGADADLLDYVTNVGAGVAMDAALPVAGAAVGKGLGVAKDSIKNTVKSDYAPLVAEARAAAEAAKRENIEQHPAVQELNAMIQEASAQFRAEPNRLIRHDIQKRANGYIQVRNETISKLQREAIINAMKKANLVARRAVPGGTLGGELASGFKDAQARGEVFEGVDGKPRFEVDDSGAKVIAKRDEYGYDLGNGAPLKDVLDHPDLYKQYPELKNVKVRVDEDLGSGEAAYLDGKDIVEIAPDARPDTILHEVQHAIQQRENFAKGGELADSIDIQRLRKEVPELPKWQKRLKEINDIELENDGSGRTGMTREERSSLAKEKYDLERRMRKSEYQVALKDYRNLAGEAEARAVQARMNMKPEERYVRADAFRDGHRAPGKDTTPAAQKMEDGGDFSLEEVIKGQHNQPSDYFDPQVGARYYMYDDVSGRQSAEAINAVKNGKKSITTYRAVPKDVKASDLQDGDWVSFSEQYAKDHGESRFGDGEYKIIKKDVPAKDVHWDGNDIREWGYDTGKTDPSKPQSTFYDSLDVPKEDLIIRNDTGKALSVEQIRNHPEMLELDSKFESLGQEIANLEKNGRAKNYSQIVQKRKSQDMILKQQKEIEARLSKQGMMMSLEAKPYRKQSPELRKAIDSVIQKENPELFTEQMPDPGFQKEMPKLRPDDVKRVTGLSIRESGIPPRYVSKNGVPLDKLAVEYEMATTGKQGQLTMTEEDYLVQYVSELERRQSARSESARITELRSDPEVAKRAQAILDEEKARFGVSETVEPSKKDVDEYYNSRGDLTLKPTLQDALAGKSTKLPKAKAAQTTTASSQSAGRGVDAQASGRKVSQKSASTQRAGRQSNSPNDAVSTQATVETSTSPKSKQPQRKQSEVARTKKGTLKPKDRSYIDNTTNVEKKRGFTQSVKASDEVSPETRKKVSGTYNVRSTEKMKLEAHKYAQGKLDKVRSEVNETLDKKLGTIADQEIADAIAVAKRLDADGKFDDSQQIYDKLAEHGTKGGQAIQAFSLLQNRTPEGVKYQMLRNLKKAGVKLTDAQQKEVGTLIDKLRKTKPNTEARNRALFDTIDYVNKKIPSNRGDKIVNIWRAGLLTAPKTTGGNIVGNLSEMGARELWANPVAIATDKFFSVFTGKRTKSNSGRIIEGTKTGIDRGVEYMKTGYDTRNVGSKYDAPRRINYKNKVVDSYVNGVYRWMGTQDQPFYYGAKAAAQYDMAKADGINLGYKGEQLAKHIENAMADKDWKPETFKTSKDATEYAKYAVYQNDTLLGSMAANVKNAADNKGLRWVTDFVLPFTQVPSSIAMRVIDRTPIGTAREIVSQVKNKQFDQRAMAEAVGNGSFGVPVVVAGAVLAQSGEITGDYPDDDKERKLWEAEGKQPYSVRIGDRWYNLNYMQPFGTILNVGRQVAEDIESGKSQAEAWMTATASAAQSVSDQSFLKGLNGVMNAINDPERSAGNFVRSTVSSTVPNFIRSFSTAIDPNKRDTKSIGRAFLGSIPGVRQTLPTKQDMFGEDQKANDTPVNQYLNPMRPSKAKADDDALVKELRRLQDSGNGIVTTTFNNKSIGGVELTDDQVRELNKAVNTIVRVEWDEAIKDPRYSELSDEEKNTVLKRIKDNVAKNNKAWFVKDNKIPTTTDYKASSRDPFTSSSAGVSINESVAKPSKSILETYNSMDSTQRDNWFKEKNDNEYKYLKARYENDKANGDIDRIDETKWRSKLRKARVGSAYSQDTRRAYSMSKDNISDVISSASDPDKAARDMYNYDKALYQEGVTKYRKFKKGLTYAVNLNSKGDTKISTAAQKTAKQHGIPSNIFGALIRQESGGNQGAVSSAGATGLTQLMPATAKGLGVNPNDPVQNLEGGARYLAEQYKRFGSWELALAAYNAGPGAVQQYGGIPPFAETQNYVRSIMGSLGDGEAFLASINGKGSGVVYRTIGGDGKITESKVAPSGSSRSSGGSGGSRGNGITVGKERVALEKRLNSMKSQAGQSSAQRPSGTPQMQRVALKRYSSKEAKDKYGKKKISVSRARA